MRPLEGITVVTLEHAIAVLFCTRQLADLGACLLEGDCLLSLHEAIAPFDLDLLRQVAIEARRGSIRLERVREDAGPLESRFGAEGEGPSIYLKDPEGNALELKGPPA